MRRPLLVRLVFVAPKGLDRSVLYSVLKTNYRYIDVPVRRLLLLSIHEDRVHMILVTVMGTDYAASRCVSVHFDIVD